jgi:hypothetical protein
VRYTCHCVAHVFDGISTIPTNEVLEIEAENKNEATTQSIKEITQKYRVLNHIGLSSVIVLSVKETDNP